MITSLEELEAIYGVPKPPSLVKVADRVTDEYRAYIEASPFVALATVGPEGLDCSPRGDEKQVVFIENERTLALPDRRGNDRIDSLKNIVRDPRVALMFMIPGHNNIIRVNGSASIHANPEILEKFTKYNQKPRSVIKIDIHEIYFQCARAPMRAGLWSGQKAPDLPSAGEILSAMSNGKVGGKQYDTDWPDRAKKSMW